ncbi:SWIM zinc finger family protein [Gordonia hydrophobica]|uniref:SWIM zinc finger family protein n=1 Tax=Gordonia hydrophobica TaxID=40516 RepID=A0ABZ2U4M9_9ACTN|nr:SWIM zinc finger family protein [Gordonia hydrophobica]MBM7366884.1 putative Zn finger protein [Gordonia hydrophobica]
MSPGRSRRTKPAVRGYGITGWSRAFVSVMEAGADHRRITGARRYFRDRHVDGLQIAHGWVTASVRGSQLDPFDVQLETRTVDPATVIDLLRRTGDADALLELARGEQPPALGDLIAPTEPADVVSDCTCPDDAPRCTHVLAVAFEVAAEIDRRPTTLLTVMGTDLPELLAAAHDGDAQPADVESAPLTVDDPFGDHRLPPPAPSFPTLDALTELDPAMLRQALRATGVAMTEVAEALDDLAIYYDVLTRRQ